MSSMGTITPEEGEEEEEMLTRTGAFNWGMPSDEDPIELFTMRRVSVIMSPGKHRWRERERE